MASEPAYSPGGTQLSASRTASKRWTLVGTSFTHERAASASTDAPSMALTAESCASVTLSVGTSSTSPMSETALPLAAPPRGARA